MRTATLLLFAILLTVTCLGAYDEAIVELQIFYNDSTLKFKDVFEALEGESVILLPINTISPYVNIQLDFNRTLDEFTVTSIDQDKSYIINTKGYNLPELKGKAPTLHGSDLYVHGEFLQLLLNAKVDYEPSTVTYFIHLPIEKKATTQNQSIEQPNSIPSTEDYYQLPYKKVVLSSVSYKLHQSFSKNQTKTNANLRFNLRAGLSDITTGFEIESINWQMPSLQSPYFNLTRQFSNSLLVIGNTGIYSKTQLKEQPFFGITYTTPYSAKPKPGVLPFELEGYAGENIKIFVNDVYIKTIVIPEGKSLSTSIDLLPNRLQTVSIERENGQRSIIAVKNGLVLTAPKDYNLDLYYGKFGTVDKEHGSLFELNYHRSLSKNASMSSALVWQKTSSNEGQDPSLRMEFSLEPFEAISTKYDFYASSQLELGHELTLYGSLPQMHWQLGYFSLPRSLRDYWQRSTGQGLNFLVEGDLTPNLSGQIEALALHREKRSDLRHYKTLLSYSRLNPRLRAEGYFAHRETQVTDSGSDLIENSPIIGFSLKKPRYFINTKYGYKHLSIGDLSSVSSYLDTKLAFSHTANIGSSLETFFQSKDSLYKSGRFSGSLQINLKNASVYSSYLVDKNLSPLPYTINREFMVSVATGRNPRLGGEIKMVNSAFNGKYTLTSSSFSSSFSNSNFQISLGLKSEGNSLDHFWKTTWSSKYTNGLTLAINLERLPRIGNNSNEYRASISLMQGLAFTENGIIGIPFTSGVSSTIAGRVFLDLNGNGIYDKGEPGLKDIELQLDSRLVKSNSDGTFLISNVREGIYTFGFNPNKLDSDYTTDLLSFPVKINKGDNLVFDMPLTINGVLKGKVYVDVDGDGTFNIGDAPIAFTKVVASNGQQAFTNEHGNYYFENLPLGSFEVTIENKTLPIGLSPPHPITIQITPEMLDTRLDFPLRY